jgi:hypothetical protein
MNSHKDRRRRRQRRRLVDAKALSDPDCDLRSEHSAPHDHSRARKMISAPWNTQLGGIHGGS